MSEMWDEEEEISLPKRYVSDINMTPFVDIMLVLLVIALLALPAVQHLFAVNLPQAQGASKEASSAAIEVTLRADGRVLWGQEVVAESLLVSRFAQAAQGARQAHADLPRVRLYAERTVPYERVVATLSAAQRSGLTQLDLVTH